MIYWSLDGDVQAFLVMPECYKTMKPLLVKLLTIVLVFASHNCQAQQIQHLSVNKKIRDSIRKEINIALADDQKYRWILEYGTFNLMTLIEHSTKMYHFE